MQPNHNRTRRRRRAAAAVAATAIIGSVGMAVQAAPAQADEVHGCKGAYVKFTSYGDLVTVKDRRADGYGMYVSLKTDYGFKRAAIYEPGAGKSFTLNYNLREHRKVTLHAWYHKDGPGGGKHCTKFTTSTS